MQNTHASGVAHREQEAGAMQQKYLDEVEDAGCVDCVYVFVGNVQSNRGGGGGTRQGGGGVQIPR